MSKQSKRNVTGLRLEHLETREVPAVIGALDPSFDTDGKVSTTFGGLDAGNAVAVQADGKIVVVGTNTIAGVNLFAVARYNPDGSLDMTFDGDGKTTIDMDGTNEQATSVAIQDDGKIVIAGFATVGGDDDFLVARLKTDGSPDTDFSGDGEVRVNFALGIGNNDQAFGVATQIVGGARKIVVVGFAEVTGNTNDFAVVRLNENGSADTSFNPGGATPSRLTHTFGATDQGRAVAIDESNRIVIAGFTGTGAANDFAVLRLSTNGPEDATFGPGGERTADFGGDDKAFAVVIQADNRIVAAGQGTGAPVDFAIARFTDTTGLDASFSGDGKATVAFGNVDVATGVDIQPDGRIVVGGFTNQGGTNNFAVARLTAAGLPDTTFDTDGMVTVDTGGADQANGIVVTPTGRILLAGTTDVIDNFSLVRLTGTVEKGLALVASGTADGKAVAFVADATGTAYNPTPVISAANFGAIPANVRAAIGDVNGDGVADAALVTGPGTNIRVAVVDGVDGVTLLVPAFDPFGGNFQGGGFVAVADIDNDGRAEVVVTPDEGGGPRVSIFSLLADSTFPVRANFFGIDDANFRGGARAALGDVNADGVADLAVSAGFLGGPRTALFTGTSLFGGTPTRITGDFFAFPGADATTLRNGVFVAIGDVSGDGFADLIFGGGPGGAPRVFVLSGAMVSAGDVAGAQAATVANYFVAGNSADRGGVRVGSTDLDGDTRAEVVAGSGEGVAARARIYRGVNFTGSGEPALFQDLTLFGGGVLTGGVFVG